MILPGSRSKNVVHRLLEKCGEGKFDDERCLKRQEKQAGKTISYSVAFKEWYITKYALLAKQ